MKQIIWGVLFPLLLAMATTAAETGYPPPQPAGKPLSVEDSIYGVLRNYHNLRGMIENREVLDHEVTRAQPGFGPRVDVTGQAGGSALSDSSARSQNLDSQMWGKLGYSAQIVQPIWDGFATRSCVSTAKSILESQRYRVFDTATSLSLDAIIAHIDLLRRRKIYEFSKENVVHHKYLVGQAHDRASLGADITADVTQAQSRLQRAFSSLSEAKASLLVAEETCTRLTGLPAASRLQTVTMPPQLYTASQAVLEKAKKAIPNSLPISICPG